VFNSILFLQKFLCEMIFDTSYYDNEIKKIIDETLGKSYSFMDRLKMKGIGSARMEIVDCSSDIKELLPSGFSGNFASIELRPKGVIVHFKKFTEHFSWIIPFYSLSIIQSNSVNIHSKGSFIKFHLRSKNTNPFFQKIIHQVGSNYSDNPTY
jgi:hypothetical protein